MITIYKDKKDIPQNIEYVELNDLFFNQNTALKLDERAAGIINQIDEAQMEGRFKIHSKFNGVILDVDCLSTGCKTVLNVLYFPDKVFCMKECGNNALEVLFDLKQGNVYSDYALIPFHMDRVQVQNGAENLVFSDYEALKEWWSDEE